MDNTQLSDQEKVRRQKMKELADKGFAQCNNCYLVNLQHVRDISGYNLRLSDGSELKISQPRKKAFMEIFRAYQAGQQKEI